MSLVRILSILLVLATAAVYFQVYQFDYLDWDDNAYVVMNPAIEGFTPENIVWAFRNEHVYNFHPLTWLSFMLDVELFGRSAAVFHIVNVVLHTANVLLLFALMRMLTKDVWRGAFVAAMFAIHPLHVESVAWISERKDVLTTLFGLLCLLAYVRYVRAERWRWVWYLMTVLAFALALLSKQTLVTLPFVLLLLDWWPLRRTEPTPSENPDEEEAAGSSWLQLVLEKIPLFVLTIAFCVIVVLVQKPGVDVAEYAVHSPLVRGANAVLCYALYLKKTVWPFDLVAFYPHPGESISRVAAGISAILLLAVTVLCVTSRQQRPYLMMGWFWFLGTLVPMIGLIQVGEQQMADRNMYFPMIGLTIMVAWLVPDLLPRQLQVTVLPTASSVLLCVFGLVAFFQVGYWQDGVSLFERTVSLTSNNYVAHNALGGAKRSQAFTARTQAMASENPQLERLSQVLLDEATTQFERSLKVNPQYADAYLNLANLKRDTGDLLAADTFYRNARQLRPEDPQIMTDYGEMLLTQQRFDEALPILQEAVKLAPYFPDAHNALGRVLAERGDTKGALREFAMALLINPQLVDAEFNLAVVLMRDNRLDDALTHLDGVLAINPAHEYARTLAFESYITSGRVLADAGDHLHAVQRFERALALATDDGTAYIAHLMAATSLTDFNPVESKAHFEQALRIQPNSVEAHLGFGSMLLKQNEKEAALEHFNKAKSLAPNDPNVAAAIREATQ